jgi:type IV pilus assembly protein PilC
MLFSSRVPLKPLAEFLRRLGMSLETGIDIRRALESEARRTPDPLRQRVEKLRNMVDGGSSLTAAMNATGKFFPALVRELVGVGEQTGHLPEVLKELTAHYDEQMALRRMFMSAISWPMLEFGFALLVVGFLIWFSGFAGTDLLGLGLRGDWGLFVYISTLVVLSISGFFLYRAIASGKAWTAPVQRMANSLPIIGGALRDLAVARFAWTLHMTLSVAVEVKRALSLSLASTQNVVFMDREPAILEVVGKGHPISEALAAARLFPTELLNAVQVGEESGRLAETLAVVARQQLEAARRTFSFLTKVAGRGVWVFVVIVMILLIARLFGGYLDTLNQALNFGKR